MPGCFGGCWRWKGSSGEGLVWPGLYICWVRAAVLRRTSYFGCQPALRASMAPAAAVLHSSPAAAPLSALRRLAGSPYGDAGDPRTAWELAWEYDLVITTFDYMSHKWDSRNPIACSSLMQVGGFWRVQVCSPVGMPGGPLGGILSLLVAVGWRIIFAQKPIGQKGPRSGRLHGMAAGGVAAALRSTAVALSAFFLSFFLSLS
jgi:hypothetical protein